MPFLELHSPCECVGRWWVKLLLWLLILLSLDAGEHFSRTLLFTSRHKTELNQKLRWIRPAFFVEQRCGSGSRGSRGSRGSDAGRAETAETGDHSGDPITETEPTDATSVRGRAKRPCEKRTVRKRKLKTEDWRLNTRGRAGPSRAEPGTKLVPGRESGRASDSESVQSVRVCVCVSLPASVRVRVHLSACLSGRGLIESCLGQSHSVPVCVCVCECV